MPQKDVFTVKTIPLLYIYNICQQAASSKRLDVTFYGKQDKNILDFSHMPDFNTFIILSLKYFSRNADCVGMRT